MYIKNQSYLKTKFRNLLLRIINYIEKNGNWHIETNGEMDFLNQFFRINENKELVIFDVGANIGDYSSLLIKLSKQYNNKLYLHCFEPVSSTFNTLQSRITNQNDIFLNNFGLSDSINQKDIFFNMEASPLASLYNRIEVSLTNKETVSLQTAKSYIEAHKIKKIHFIKLDVEGHEIIALKGFDKYLNKDFIDLIQFEYGGANIDSRTLLLDFFELLEPQGFKIFKIVPNHLERIIYNKSIENFTYSNFVAISTDILSKI